MHYFEPKRDVLVAVVCRCCKFVLWLFRWSSFHKLPPPPHPHCVCRCPLCVGVKLHWKTQLKDLNKNVAFPTPPQASECSFAHMEGPECGFNLKYCNCNMVVPELLFVYFQGGGGNLSFLLRISFCFVLFCQGVPFLLDFVSKNTTCLHCKMDLVTMEYAKVASRTLCLFCIVNVWTFNGILCSFSSFFF